jgi:multidrug efflux pump subunit AcrA (membrane-fusion protein)
MRLRLVGTLLLVIVGIAAIFVTLFPPGGSATSSTRYQTAAATRTNVVQQIVATGTVGPVTTYDLAFGSQPVLATSSSSSASSGNGNSTVAWRVTEVAVTPGQAVASGNVLATADDSDAQLALTVAQANLDSAEARLSSDKGGLSATDKAAAKLSVTQAKQSLSQARTSRTQTTRQNNLKLSQQKAAVSAAKRQLTADKAASPPASSAQLDQDRAAVTQAENSLASLRLQIDQSNTQAANQVRSAQNQVKSAQLAYRSKIQGATDAQIASDEAAVATAEQAVASAQATVDAASLASPVDGVVVSVNISKGVDAPSGAAIVVQSDAFEVSASIAESDLPSLQIGQDADVTITATAQTATGKVTEISPIGSSGTGGGVVSYPIVVSLPTPPAGTASGMSAQVSVTTASASDVVAVPSIALVGSAGSYSVRVLDGSGNPQLVAVQVGLVTSSMAEIQGGISEGTDVVVGTSSTRQGSTTTTGGFGGGGLGGGGLGGGNFKAGQP